jgi:hypothetical protein
MHQPSFRGVVAALSRKAPDRRAESILDIRSVCAAGVVSRASAALVAGTIAIVLNTLALDAAQLVPLATGNGGLLRFLMMLTGGAVSAPAGAVFQTGFHIVIGLAMALFYAFALEPWMRVPSWLGGVLFATAVWLINAFIVLPTIGEGIADSRGLTLVGMAWFALAHTLFFLVLAILFDRLHPYVRRTTNPALTVMRSSRTCGGAIVAVCEEVRGDVCTSNGCLTPADSNVGPFRRTFDRNRRMSVVEATH